MHLTTKQIALMSVIVAGNPDGSVCDLDEIVERASYKPTKASIHFSIRALVKHGLIEKLGLEKRRGRSRVLISATALGREYMGPRASASIATSVEEDELAQEISKI